MTEHARALARETDQTRRLDSYLEAIRRNGTLAQFNAAYKAYRLGAKARNAGAMTYSVALAKLKKALTRAMSMMP